jgi:isoleucyl-tRNA synthetase
MLKKLEKFSLPEIEEKVLEFWKTDKIFEKSLAKNAKKKQFFFYEGPPTANGRPGIHHILARAFKDIIPRYKTMAGFHVPRRAGWDTHGLPVELEVEKKLGLKSKKEIEKFGIAEFNQKCKESVWLYKDEWERLTERMGFWLDMENPYVTYENSYIESVWNILKHVWDKKLLYKGHKVVPWCPRCGTGLSSHELALGYKEATDTSVYIKFKARSGATKPIEGKVNNNFSILSWTTTPWTLPGNVALAVGKNVVYAVVKHGNEYLLLAKDLIKQVFGEDKDVIQELRGEALIGLEYEPLFDVPALKSKTSYKIYDAKFVTTTDGTGVVHTAVMYGVDDYEFGKKIGLPEHHLVDEQGRFTKDVKGFEGMVVKSKDMETERKTTDAIIEHLKSNNQLLKTEAYIHEYPFCWRCSTPLIYYARDSWFIAMSKLRPKLLAANKKINWVPENIKNGRFGEWLKEVKDWAISRERYWGTPLPIWVCDECEHKKFIGSIKELGDSQKKSSNRYILVRHGGAENNLRMIIDCIQEKSVLSLTLKGRNQVEELAKKLKKEKIDEVFASDFMRTKETAEILQSALGLKKIHFDKRLRENNAGDFNGQSIGSHSAFYKDDMEKFVKRPPNGENLTDVRSRLFSFVNEKEKEFSGKTILIVSHECPIWMLTSVLEGWGNREAVLEDRKRGEVFIKNAGMEIHTFHNLPRNDNGEMDIHRPYLDGVKIICDKCNGKMERVKEVIDVWFDSGAMPFAQDHWPFAQNQKSKIKNQKFGLDYPADYISEAMDQTRGWFYTLLAIGVLMGKNSPYKNVICLGLIMDKNGQKMSKSKGNIADPWEAMKKHGVDAIRWYFYTVNPPGEPKKFDEAEITKTSRQIFSLLYNSFVFLETYRSKNSKFEIRNSKSSNTLDRWILSRLNETIDFATKKLNAYEIGEAGRMIENFVGDLSRWYIRRSRRRFQKPEDQKDYVAASEVLNYALVETSKLTAPFAPFFSEALYKSLMDEESVHLADWPKADEKMIDKKLTVLMDEVRNIASNVLAKRAEIGIKVRQPLASLKIKDQKSKIKDNKELLEILKDEVNVKEIKFDAKLKTDFELDTKITHELKEEGTLRELIRTIQDLRQDAKLKPRDTVELYIDGADEIKFIVSKYGDSLKKEVKAKRVEIGKPPRFDAEIETRIDEMPVWIGIKK